MLKDSFAGLLVGRIERDCKFVAVRETLSEGERELRGAVAIFCDVAVALVDVLLPAVVQHQFRREQHNAKIILGIGNADRRGRAGRRSRICAAADRKDAGIPMPGTIG